MKALKSFVMVNTFVITLFGSQSVFARKKCNMDVTTNNISLTLGSFGSTVPGSVSMVRRKSADSFICYMYSYGFGTGNANSFTRFLVNSRGERIYYNLFKNGNKIVEISDQTPISTTFWGWSIGSQPSVKSFDLKVETNSNSTYPAGTYSDSIAVKLYSGLPGSPLVLEDTKNFTISLNIPSEISLSLVDVGSAFDPADTHQTMDFGELTTGESMEADLKVLSNSGYRIYMESENKGKLKNISENSKISYDLFINGSKKKLKKKKSKVAEGSGSTPTSGENHRIRVVIGNVSGAKAGIYTDNITITAEAK